MHATAHLLGLIEQLYAAPGTIDGWHAFLESLRGALHGSAARLISHASGEDFARRCDTVRSAAGMVEVGPEALSVISVNGSEHREPLGDEDAALLEALVPHIRRAMQLHRRLLLADSASEDFASVMDSAPRPVLLVGSGGRIIFMNQAAVRLTGMRDGLRMDDGELRAGRVADTTRLRSLLDDAAGTSSGRGVGTGGVLALGRPSGRRPLVVLVCPLSSQRALFAGVGPAVAVVFVTDPDQVVIPDAAALRVLFGLTPAEAKVTRLVAQGATLAEAAARLGVTRETIRTRMKTIFEKTDTHRQAELVRLVVNAAPHV
jgi:DNA-binding CsgD family transcriptional regulator